MTSRIELNPDFDAVRCSFCLRYAVHENIAPTGGLIICDYCCRDTYPGQRIERVEVYLEDVDSILIAVHSPEEETSTSSSSFPPEEEDFDKIWKCSACSSTSMLFVYTCDCHETVICNTCYLGIQRDASSRPFDCPTCEVKKPVYDDYLQHDYFNTGYLSCSLCQTKCPRSSYPEHLRNVCTSRKTRLAADIVGRCGTLETDNERKRSQFYLDVREHLYDALSRHNANLYSERKVDIVQLVKCPDIGEKRSRSLVPL